MIEVMTNTPASSGYTLWAVFRRDPHTPNIPDPGSLTAAVASVEKRGVTVRGFYDVSSLRADADLMVWLHGGAPEDLQWALRELRRSSQLKSLLPTWNAMGVHRDAEFTSNHLPAFMRGKEPETWLTVYPFVRSYEWYLLPDDERRKMLVEHGMAARGYPDVRANTVPAFSLGDYEWLLAFEADELHRIVDLMRDLRATEARRHVREEIPFFTGPRVRLSEIVAALP